MQTDTAIVAMTLAAICVGLAPPAIAQEKSACQYAQERPISLVSVQSQGTEDKPSCTASPLVIGALQFLPLPPLERLPSIDSIDAKTDITGFMRSGVPAELRTAALRRAWVLDPAIHDFKGLVEIDWDFTHPDEIPGFGELGPEVDTKSMLAQILGEPARAGEHTAKRPESPYRISSQLKLLQQRIFDR